MVCKVLVRLAAGSSQQALRVAIATQPNNTVGAEQRELSATQAQTRVRAESPFAPNLAANHLEMRPLPCTTPNTGRATQLPSCSEGLGTRCWPATESHSGL